MLWVSHLQDTSNQFLQHTRKPTASVPQAAESGTRMVFSDCSFSECCDWCLQYQTCKTVQEPALHTQVICLIEFLLFFCIQRLWPCSTRAAGQIEPIIGSSTQTEKSQPQGKWIMPETRLTMFPVLSVDQRVGISLSALETDY